VFISEMSSTFIPLFLLYTCSHDKISQSFCSIILEELKDIIIKKPKTDQILELTSVIFTSVLFSLLFWHVTCKMIQYPLTDMRSR